MLSIKKSIKILPDGTKANMDAGKADIAALGQAMAELGADSVSAHTQNNVFSRVKFKSNGTVTASGYLLGNGTDLSGVFARATTVPSAGSGTYLTNVSLTLANGILSLGRSFGTPYGNYGDYHNYSDWCDSCSGE